MNGFTYTLTLLEPVLANSLGGEPNSANSLFYIPGGLVRGAAINAYKGVKDAGDEKVDFRRLFLDGSVRFLNAYPVSENGRALPTPLQYKKPKYFEGGDLSTIKDGKVHALEEIWQINVHTQRDAESGHAKEKAGAVYRYISLPAGLILEGAVLADESADAEKIKELLLNEANTILLGKARTAGYGKARIETGELKLNEGGELSTSKVDEFTLTLLSPAIVRDENGQPTLDISIALSARLGVDVEVTKASRRGEVVGGFNRTWGLPLPQVTAIAAGSVFKVKASVDAIELEGLQDKGIGERRAEGFGRVMVNQDLPDIKRDDLWPNPVSATMTESEKSAGLSENPTAKLMVTRLARKELDEKVVHTARQMTEDYKGNIPNSQLSRWRVVIRTALDKKNVTDLQNFLKESKGKTGWKKMEKARVKPGGAPQRLTEWMEEWLENSAKLQEVLKPQLDHRFSLGDNSFKFNDELNLEYRLRLLDAVLAVMAKKNGGSND
jgi:CRISPR-associated protein Csx10